MDDFHRLLAFTRASENCYGLALRIIDSYGDQPEFSRFLSVEGRPYCQPTANWQARSHMECAERKFANLEEAISEWDAAARRSVDYVQKAAANQNLPVINVLGTTCASAHEAAREFAKAMHGVMAKVAGDGDIEQAFDLARLLAEFRTVPDFSAFITRESLAAEDLTPPLEDDDDDAWKSGDESGGQEDAAEDSEIKLPRSNRVLKAISYVNRYITRAKKTRAPIPPLNAIISEHLSDSTDSRPVTNLCRQLRNYKPLLLPPIGLLEDAKK